MQTTPAQLQPVPPQPQKPTCGNPLFVNSPCDQAWQQYRAAETYRTKVLLQNAMVTQRLIGQAEAAKEQQALAQSEIAKVKSAAQSLVAQHDAKIAELQATIQHMQSQAQADQQSAAQTAIAARQAGVRFGAEVGVSASLLAFALAIGVRRLLRLRRPSVTARAASV